MKTILKFVTLAVFAAFASTSLPAQSNPLLGARKLNIAKSKSDPMSGSKRPPTAPNAP